MPWISLKFLVNCLSSSSCCFATFTIPRSLDAALLCTTSNHPVTKPTNANEYKFAYRIEWLEAPLPGSTYFDEGDELASIILGLNRRWKHQSNTLPVRQNVVPDFAVHKNTCNWWSDEYHSDEKRNPSKDPQQASVFKRRSNKGKQSQKNGQQATDKHKYPYFHERVLLWYDQMGAYLYREQMRGFENQWWNVHRAPAVRI